MKDSTHTQGNSPQSDPVDPHGMAPESDFMRSYQDRILTFASRIRRTTDLGEIIDLLSAALQETRALGTHDALVDAKRQVSVAESKIQALRAELDAARTLVAVDPLTGTLNRRGTEEAFLREAARSDRHGTPFCAALLDLDDFKRLNDTHGHQTGDAALCHVASVLRHALRPNDIVGRYGGEEFLVLLPETRMDAALAAMTRLKRELASAALVHRRARLSVTFSAGVAARARGETYASVVGRADKALYQAKYDGKNRAVAAPGTSSATGHATRRRSRQTHAA